MGLAASQARMQMLSARKADQELEMGYLAQVQSSLADMTAAIFNSTELTPGLQSALQIDEANPHDDLDKRREVMARIAKLNAADDLLGRQWHKIEEQHEAVQDELGKVQDDIAAAISTSFQLMDGPNQHASHLNRPGYPQRRSNGPSTHSLPPSPLGGESLRPFANSRLPSPIEIHQQCSVDPPEATQLVQPSERLPLWRCICWHIWFCVLSTTISSCTFGIFWSTAYKNISDAFTVASYMLAAGTLVSGVLMFKHNEACVQRAKRKRGESRNEGIFRLTLNGRSR